MNIRLDSSVQHITKTACMVFSGTIQNGLMLTNNINANIVIYKDRIEFGKCYHPDLEYVTGLIFPNFYKEYGNIVYRFGTGFKCSVWNKTLDYVGVFPPTEPDNSEIFRLIYPKFS